MKSSKSRQYDIPNLNRNQRSNENKQRYIDGRGGVCEACGEKYPVELMDFHHLDPTTKVFCLGQDKWRKKEVQQIVFDEAEKCAILCSNCHRLEHVALRRGESIINDKEAYHRYRNHRFTDNEPEQGSHDRDDGPTDEGDPQLDLEDFLAQGNT